MIGSAALSNGSLMAEVSILCPALLSLIKPPADGDTPPHNTILYDIMELLRRPECASTISSYFDSKVTQPRVYGGGGNFEDAHTNMKPSVGVVHAGGGSRETAVDIRPTYNGLDGLVDRNEVDEYWPAHIRLIMSIIFMILSSIGIVGNILVVIVVLKVPGMKTPTNCYLVSLAISDCMFFVAAAPTEMSYLHVASSKYVFGEVGWSSMSITAFTVERFIGICYPLRARYICTVKRAKFIIFFIWIFCILYNSPWLYLATLKEDSVSGQECTFKLDRDNWTYKVMFLGDFSAFYLIPMVLYVYIYGKITCTLSQCGLKCSETMISPTAPLSVSTAKANSAPNSNPTATQKHREYFVSSGNRKNSTKNKVQVIKMLAVVVFIFAVCWLPYRAMVMWNSFASSSRWDPDWYIFLSKTMIFLNCAINPVLYNVMSGRFRNAFKRLFEDKLKTNKFNRNSWNSPTTIVRPNKHKLNGAAAATIVTSVTIAAGDGDTAKAIEAYALVQYENGNLPMT